MSEPRYLIDRLELFTVTRIDRETPYYWWEWRNAHDPQDDGWWSRHKKQAYTDLAFDSFEEAKAEVIRRLSIRLSKAQLMTEPREWLRESS